MAEGLVIVTGGSRGIGAAAARRLAGDGYAAAVVFTSQPDPAHDVVRQIQAAGGAAAAFRADVSVESEVDGMFAAAQERFGPVVGLVNSAGIIGAQTRFEAYPLEAMRHLLEVNVVGTMLPCRAAVRAMSTKRGGRGGAIVNLSSAAARLGGAGEIVPYAATKGAIDSFTIGLGREVAEEGIRVNAVAPGMIATEMNSAERLGRLVPAVPMKRAGTADEVAEAIAWLISPAASYLCGSIVTVSGGR